MLKKVRPTRYFSPGGSDFLFSLTNTYQSMGLDGFSQAQYLQLALDIRCGNPPPQPSLIIRLPLSNRYLRKRRMISSDPESSDDETGANEVLESHPQTPRDRHTSILNETNRITHRSRTDRGEGQKDDTDPVQEKITAFQASCIFPSEPVNTDLHIQLLTTNQATQPSSPPIDPLQYHKASCLPSQASSPDQPGRLPNRSDQSTIGSIRSSSVNRVWRRL